MKQSGKEIDYMKTELEMFFSVISDWFKASTDSSHFKYTYHLRGSMHDNCKCFGPNEFDAVLKIMNLKDLDLDIDSLYTFKQIKGSGRWRAYCDDGGYLIICDVAQDFYTRFSLQCNKQNNNLRDKSCGFTQVAFQCLAKFHVSNSIGMEKHLKN